MDLSFEFLKKTLDAIDSRLVVIDEAGVIRFANQIWSNFNECDYGGTPFDTLSTNYLDACDEAAAMGDKRGLRAGLGIRRVLNGEEDEYCLEYPCHSPEQKRWFMLRVKLFTLGSINYAILSHDNITERKLAQEEANELARLDPLTDIANRRSFDEFLHNEFRRCRRLQVDLSVAIIDLDHFKLLNDTYGHLDGDTCLLKVSEVLKEFTKRPGDLCARIGGEEFAIIWGDSSLKKSISMSNTVLRKIRDLKIPNRQSPVHEYLTASIGLATVTPVLEYTEKQIIEIADKYLYQAKENGRARLVSGRIKFADDCDQLKVPNEYSNFRRH